MNRPIGSERPGISAGRAVAIGHLIVNGPVAVLVLAAVVVGFLRFGLPGVSLFVLPAVIVGWLWWSLAVPRWRRWALRRGADPDRLQYLGQITGLVWPKGFILENTEFRPKDEDGRRPPRG